MQGLKIVFVAALAILAVGSDASRLRRSPTDFDIRLIIENARDISSAVFKHLNAGVKDVDPFVQNLLNEMAPEARDGLKEVIQDIRNLLKEEEDRFTVIFKTLIKALDDMKPIKAPCADKYAKDAKKVANDIEVNIVKFVNDMEKKHEKIFSKITKGIDSIIKKARTLFDAEIPAIAKCLTPKNKDATKCINTEMDKSVAGIVEIATEGLLLLNSSQNDLKPVINEIGDKLIELVLKAVIEGKPIINKISNCVAAM